MAEQWQATSVLPVSRLSQTAGPPTATALPRRRAEPRLKPRPSQSSGFRRLAASRFRRRQGQKPLQKLLVCGWHLWNTVPTSLEPQAEPSKALSTRSQQDTKPSPRGRQTCKQAKRVCENGHGPRGHKSQSTAPGEGGEKLLAGDEPR